MPQSCARQCREGWARGKAKIARRSSEKNHLPAGTGFMRAPADRPIENIHTQQWAVPRRKKSGPNRKDSGRGDSGFDQAF
jgi:hypothetical protein